ncbi:aminodeoxychorismate lyase [Cupriavidus sp. USMAA2-4]|uniref:Endolytic murein transglycosylase n=1 Tax=Cupriavidus malaysiensis TaxID=367825 RepID=A0ABM6F4F4_9BURK|nr:MULTISPECIES: endolytic transglycosylase MltG [Cupriavidus]AOY90661.1 aminodeoxychorismate lyase [Cupriavidus sp. USMAA2-4]AOY99714.1 aminodeoxychorismate lyase [Cupriavidus sp. USMAHM13]AOZ06337.1 aminodeoxychorismate lyase [Cupriavidus malaysiensis]
MKRVLVRLAAACVVFALAATGAFAWWARHPLPLSGSPLEVIIQPNSSVASVGRQIARGGVGMDPRLFLLLARLTGKGGELKAGGYTFEQGATPLSVLEKIARGDVTHYVVTVIEGWEFRKMRAAIDASPALKHDTRGMSDADLMRAIGAPESAPEGLFFPDTYLFTRGSSDLELYKHAYRAMQRRLADAWAARASGLPYKSPYDALIMASIVEKETGQAADRSMIAAVFINRLRKNMLLQTDPTVIYGLGERFDGNLRKRDLQADTPYNTYTRSGLPPTPIALPSLASLAAAMTPAQSDALYFVARGDGSSQFSNSLPEHNRAVDQYQRGKTR